MGGASWLLGRGWLPLMLPAFAGLIFFTGMSNAAYVTPTCHFISSMPDLETKMALNKRCLDILASKYINLAGQRGVSVHDRLCGVLNPANVSNSEICYSTPAEAVSLTLLQSVRLEQEIFFPDYTDVRKKRFKRKKTELERAWNKVYFQNWTAMTGSWNLERVVLYKMAQSLDQAPNSTSTRGVEVTFLVQFGPGSDVTVADFISGWLDLSTTTAGNVTAGTRAKWAIDRFKLEREYYTEVITETLPTCNDLTTLERRVPVILWNNSVTQPGLPTTGIPIGTTVEFKCPPEMQLSEDEDGFSDHDNSYSLECTSTRRYKEPYKWPNCRVPCPVELPDPDPNSLMSPVDPKTRIPEGKFGRYMCDDPTLGVDQGPSEYLEVLCLPDQTYDVPPAGYWPRCRDRTTTISPAIPVAINEMLERKTIDLNYRVKVVQYGQMVKSKDNEDWMLIMTLPSIIGMTLFIFFICILTRNDSPLYRCCKEEDKDVDNEAEEIKGIMQGETGQEDLQ